MAGLNADDVAGVANRDPAALRRVYGALAPAVHGYALARGSADPEGVVQEVFLAVFTRETAISGGVSGLRTLVFSVAHARLVDEARQRSRRPIEVEYASADDPRQAPSAEYAAVGHLTQEAALALLRELPPAQREVVALRVVAGMSLDETAAIVQRSVGAVKQLQRRGLLALRELAVEGGVTNDHTGR